jgi:hypothetical protein
MTIGTTTAAMVTTPHSRYVVTPFNAAGVVRFQVNWTLFLKSVGALWKRETTSKKEVNLVYFSLATCENIVFQWRNRSKSNI